MNLGGAIDMLGDAGIVLAGLAVGLLFGFMAQRSRFCLRSAVIEFATGSIGPKTSVWLLTFSTALVSVQTLTALGLLDTSQARLFTARGSLSGAIVGGLLFGAGMILARGCASRLLVLSANGNLRALLSGLVFAVTAQASYQGVLSPVREMIAGLWTIDGGASRELLALLGLENWTKLAAASVCLAVAICFAMRNRLPFWAWFGGAGTGAVVALAWLLTYGLSQQSFEIVPVMGVTFSGPSAQLLMRVLSFPVRSLNFDMGLVPGVFAGSFMAASIFGETKLEGFRDGHSMRRYLVGAILMGFGAMLAGGCAVGAGVTGGSVFSVTSWVALTAMWVGSGATHWALDYETSSMVARYPQSSQSAVEI